MHEPRAAEGGDAPIRPIGAMTAAMRAARSDADGPRYLRYAVLAGGKIVDEQVVPPTRALTVGDASSATVHVPGIAGAHRLLAYEDGAWVLRHRPEIQCRLHTGLLDAARDEGRTVHRLEENARARIELGKSALLVQLIERPPVRQRPVLPPHLVGGVMERADWWFTSFVCASFLAHFMVLAFVMEADWPIDPTPIPAYAAHVIFDEPPLPEPERTPEMTSETEATEVAEAETTDDGPVDARPVSPSRTHHHTVRDSTLADADAREAARAMHAMIGTLFADADQSGTDDLLRRGRESLSQEEVMSEVDGVDVGSSDDLSRLEERRRGDDGDGARRALAALAAERGARGTRSRVLDEGAPVREVVLVRPPRDDDVDPIGAAEFDPRELLQRLRQRMGRVQHCYEREISHGAPDAAGRITLSMTVMPVGSLSRVHAEDNNTGSAALGQCAVDAVRTVRVSAGPESPVEIRYPIVFSRQD